MRVRAKRVILGIAVPFFALLCGGCPGADPFAADKLGDSASSFRIEAITPSHGPAGTRVTIRGGPFEEQIGVLFGAHAAVDPILVNSRMITAIAPPQSLGTVDVTVLSNGGEITVLGAFTYEAPLVRVDSVEPAFGPIEGGTMVTLRGALMPPDAGVLFGNASAAEVKFINEQLVTAIAPTGREGVVDVTLVYSGGKVVVPGAFHYGDDPLSPDDGLDSDGDGLTDKQERAGWGVWIEKYGLDLGTDTFGNIVDQYAVTSDPYDADTDKDGLSDEVEFLIRSDPRKYDSDDDGLRDAEEWNQWLTSPTSVDTDGDARGGPAPDDRLPPNQALFDGLELFDQAVLRLPPDDPLRVVKPRATSPTLSDTDGDGVSDFDEFDSTVRNGVLADLPRLEYELVGDVDVRLMTEYAESAGETVETGVTLTRSETETVASSFSNTVGWSLEVMVGLEFKASIIPESNVKSEITAGVHGEYTWTTSNETSHTASEEKSRLTSKSKEFTETAAEGAIRTAILLRNPGNTTFTVDGLGVVVSQREKLKRPGDTSPQTPPKTIATMTPVFDTITLAPGETAGPFELAATGVNAESIKELLARPDTLMLGTASMNFTDSAGLDFDFVRQFTVAQTATIVIDFGDGEVRAYNVATNVDRNPDSSYRGITLRRAFEEVLGLPYGDPIHGYTTMASRNPGHHQTLQSLLGREYAEGPGGEELEYWTVMTSNPDHVNFDWNDVVLRAGDSLHLMFQRDDDGDGLNNTLEKFAGTDQDPLSPGDADGDTLTDRFEVIDGWIAFEDPANPNAPHPDGFAKRRVWSSPTSADSDGDGLTDDREFAARSDPLDPDTDGDGLIDGVDPFPIRPAGIRFVKADAAAGGNGRTWLTAYRTIQEALSAAAAGQATPALPDDDVSQIWVARGTYKPSSRLSPIELRNNVGIYGGFSGPGQGFETGETKRGQRNTNPFANGCVISGDLLDNDTGDINLDTPGTYTENCPRLVFAGSNVRLSAVLDGFMITGAYAQATITEVGGALSLSGSPTIQNCLITRNGNQVRGAGVRASGASSALFKKCILAANVANQGGGAYLLSLSGTIVFEDCEFSQNEARRRPNTNSPPSDDPRAVGGAVSVDGRVSGRVDFNRCVFTGNQAWNLGGGIYALGSNTVSGGTYVRVDSCRFYGNSTTTTGSWVDFRGCGGAMHLDADASVSNSVFWDNRAKHMGGAISVIVGGDGYPPPNVVRRVAITNCTIAYNRSAEARWEGGGIFTAGSSSNISVANTIIWNNYPGVDPIPDNATFEERMQVYDWNWHSVWSVSNSCLNAGWPNRWRGRNNNINADPSFIELKLGDLRLGPGSPCVDRGNTFVDLDPLLPGLQQLPPFDLFGNPRVVDGNNDGIVAVDIGAFEVRPR